MGIVGRWVDPPAKMMGTLYEYDTEDQLIRVVREDGSIVRYEYDGLGRRVEKDVDGQITRYIYDAEDVLLELDGSNNIIARYTHNLGFDQPLIMERGGQFFFYHTDGLGSITEITDVSGTVVQSYSYSSFGKIESQLDPNFTQPFIFTARENNLETGLYHYRARKYDPSLGRFLQEEPIAGPLELSQSRNKYAYALNNPTLFVDPNGLGPRGAAIGGTIGATIGGFIGAGIGGVGGGAAGTLALPGGGTVVGAGAGGTLGFLKGSAIGLVAGAVVGSIIEDASFLLDTPNICPLVFFSKPPKDRPEHTKRARPSTKDKHERGRGRVKKDRPGGEKGDERRPFRNK